MKRLIYVGDSPLKYLFTLLYRIALLPHGSVADHWDLDTLSWSLSFRRSLKEAEIAELQSLLSLLSSEKVFNYQDHKIGSIDHQGRFTIKSLSVHLHSVSPMDKCLFKALWKSNSPRRVNILMGHAFWVQFCKRRHLTSV